MLDFIKTHRHTSKTSDISSIDPRLLEMMDVEKTRLLFKDSLITTGFLAVFGIVCMGLLISNATSGLMLSIWLIWVLFLCTLRELQSHFYFKNDTKKSQAPFWKWSATITAGLTGGSLPAVVLLIPVDAPIINYAIIFGLIFCVTLTACASYIMREEALIACLVLAFCPISFYLIASSHQHLHPWGYQIAIVFVAMSLLSLYLRKLFVNSLNQSFENKSLINHLEESRFSSENINDHLKSEIDHRKTAELHLHHAQQMLEVKVKERTNELSEAINALTRSRASLSLALKASRLSLLEWDLTKDDIHESFVSTLVNFLPNSLNAKERNAKLVIHPDDLESVMSSLSLHFQGQTADYKTEFRIKHPAGGWIWVEDRGQIVERDIEGHATRMLGTRQDVTEYKHLLEEQKLSAIVFESAQEGVIIMDIHYRPITCNHAYTEISGFSKEHLLLENKSLIEHHDEASNIRESMQLLSQWSGDGSGLRIDGSTYPQHLKLNGVRNNEGKLTHIIAIFTDLTASKKAAETLEYLSNHDTLTGLANRSNFKQALFNLVQNIDFQTHQIAVLQINVDRFKLVNDSLGQDKADQVLKVFAERLSTSIPEGNTIARLSGDEFAVIMHYKNNELDLSALVKQLIRNINQPTHIDEQELILSASIGISLMPDNTKDNALLLSQANLAMQHAKGMGGNHFHFYDSSLYIHTAERLNLENKLRKALINEDLQVFYQPKMNIQTGKINAVEALVRWKDEEMGWIPPIKFIGLAEETGLIGAIGEYVLRTACKQVSEWQSAQDSPICIAVNVSVHQLMQGNMPALVESVLKETGISPELIELELTETQLLEDGGNVSDIIHQLKHLGVKLSVDDFGTGYSSFSYLKRFPIDCVKIDRSFVKDLTPESGDAKITRAIIEMAHNLGLKVVAEGVENDVQLSCLRHNQCDEIQGFLISPALPAEQLIALRVTHHNESIYMPSQSVMSV